MFFGFILGTILGWVTAWGPTWILLRNQKRLSGPELAKAYPSKAWIRWAFPILFWVLVFALFYLVVFWATPSTSVPHTPDFLIPLVIIVGLGIYCGFFEIVTGVSPVMRHNRWPRYIYSNRVKKTGYVRVFAGVFVLTAACVVLWFSS
jgi:hypothetical protein